MFEIVDARWLAADIKRFEVRVPRVAAKQQPGQFVIVRVHDHGERVPLTIADSDPIAGTITLVVQKRFAHQNREFSPVATSISSSQLDFQVAKPAKGFGQREKHRKSWRLSLRPTQN